jgi:hypothetical protein
VILDAFFRSLTQEAEKTAGFVRVVAREGVLDTLGHAIHKM